MRAARRPGSVGRLAALLLLLFALVAPRFSCASQRSSGASPPVDAQSTMRIHVVRHGWHSGTVVRAADVPKNARPAQREFVGAESLEVGWGARAYHQAPVPSMWLGLRALPLRKAGRPANVALMDHSDVPPRPDRQDGQDGPETLEGLDSEALVR